MGSLTAIVLGSTGMLGQAVLKMLSAHSGWHVYGTQQRNPSAANYLNATDSPEEWGSVISRTDYIINCIGVLKRDINVTDGASVGNAIRVNALFPHSLSEIAALSNARIVHISTDGVFSGRSRSPYVEIDPTDSVEVYGKTKALGECPAMNVLNIRCSVVGCDRLNHRGLMEWFLQSPNGSELPGFEDQLWNGVTTVQVATLCERILESESFDRVRTTSGIHHFSPNSPISKYELLCEICSVSHKEVVVRPARSGMNRSLLLGSCFEDLHSIYSGRSSWTQLIKQVLEN